MQIPSTHSSNPEGVPIMKGSTMLTNGSLMGPQGTGPADSVTPGMLSASLAPSSHINAPHINAPRTLAEALAMVVDDEALSSLVLPPLPLAPPGLMTAENCRNGGDTHFLEGTAEQEVVVIDDLDDCDRGVNNEMANAGLRPTGDHQECIAMTKNEDVDITETPHAGDARRNHCRCAPNCRSTREFTGVCSRRLKTTPRRDLHPHFSTCRRHPCRQVTPRLQRSCRRS